MELAMARQQQLQDWAQGAIRRQFAIDPGVVISGFSRMCRAFRAA